MERWIVATGGGGFFTDPDGDQRRERHVLSLARSADPALLFVGTAGGDNDEHALRFYRTARKLGCRATDLPLFDRTEQDIESLVLAHDVVVVGGGSTANLLAVWRVHGLDAILRAAWDAGIVLCGASAGMNCWFESSVTDSFNLGRLTALHDGLGFLRGSACPHYDAEPERRPTYLRLLETGELEPGHAADDEAALVFAGTDLHEVVAATPTARGYRVSAGAETELPTRLL